MNKGFTLIELVVVIGIIVLLTALTLPNYRAGDKQLSLQRSVSKLSQDLRRAQEMAMSSREFIGAPPTFRGGYGIYFNLSQPGQYILFADLDNENDYDTGEAVETLVLESKIIIDSLSPSGPLTIVFIPPDPTIVFSPDAAIASITVINEETKTVQINKAGLIAIE